MIGYISSNLCSCHIKTRAQVPTVSGIEGLEYLVDLQQWSGGYLLQKCTLLTGNNFHASLRVEKKYSLLLDLSKGSKSMRHYTLSFFFSAIMQIICSEPNYAISHPCIILEAMQRKCRCSIKPESRSQLSGRPQSINTHKNIPVWYSFTSL